MAPPLLPALTMHEIYGPNHVYAPRAHPSTCDWLIHDAAVLDAITANQLAIAGDMPIICSSGGATPLGLEVLADAGLQPATSIHTFKDEHHAIELAKEFGQSGVKVVVQHIYPQGELTEDEMWIEHRLLSYLNNKANLPELVPAANVAPRRVMEPAEFWCDESTDASTQLPVVLKAATDLSSGGGADVAVCHTPGDLAAARQRFAACERMVVESFQSVRRNLCLHYAVMPDATPRYLSFAAQDVGPGGQYRGNWLFLGSTLPCEVIEIGLDTVSRAARLGYRGLVGIDVIENTEGRWLVLDLNFRVNGSTAPVLLAPALHRRFGQSVMHLRGFTCQEPFSHLTCVTSSAARTGKLIPLGSYDPVVAGRDGQPARLSALVVGESQSDIERVEAELASSGLR